MTFIKYHGSLMAAAVMLVFLASAPSWAAPIGAKAVYVEGTVTVISAVDSKSYAVEKGRGFVEGDKVTTAAASELEIEFDTGDLVRLDENTDMVIKSLSRNEAGSTSSVFGMAAGRLKAAVTKLADKSSRFEVHTKAAICGVAGTPPFVVESFEEQTFIDLLGEIGAEGQVYVEGTGGARKRVLLAALMRTIVRFGEDPLDPFPVTPDRLRELNRALRFEFEKITGRKPASDESMMIESLARRLSVPRPADPSDPGTMEKLERQYDQGRGGGTDEAVSAAPPVTRGTIKIQIK